jgi:hypothetical protein
MMYCAMQTTESTDSTTFYRLPLQPGRSPFRRLYPSFRSHQRSKRTQEVAHFQEQAAQVVAMRLGRAFARSSRSGYQRIPGRVARCAHLGRQNPECTGLWVNWAV